MALGAIGKEFLRFAGPALKSSAGAMLKAGGTVGEEAAKAALGYGIQKFRPDLVGKATAEIPKLLRSTSWICNPHSRKNSWTGNSYRYWYCSSKYVRSTIRTYTANAWYDWK